MPNSWFSTPRPVAAGRATIPRTVNGEKVRGSRDSGVTPFREANRDTLLLLRATLAESADLMFGTGECCQYTCEDGLLCTEHCECRPERELLPLPTAIVKAREP